MSYGVPLFSLTALLDATPALEVLELNECASMNATGPPTKTTTLGHLTHLTIRRMATRVAAALMPALVLPRATVVCLSFAVNADAPPTDALLPQPQHWRAATRVRVDQRSYSGSLSIELEGDAHRVALCLDYGPNEDWTALPLWPLAAPTLAQLPNVSAAHLSIYGSWKVALPRYVARVPAITTLVVEGRRGDEATAREMVDALRDLLLLQVNRCAGLKEVALGLPCGVYPVPADGTPRACAEETEKGWAAGREVEDVDQPRGQHEGHWGHAGEVCRGGDGRT